jgi:hypothetical protein
MTTPLIELFPASSMSANAKTEPIPVPSGLEDEYCGKADMNAYAGHLVPIVRALRMSALVAAITNTGEAIAKNQAFIPIGTSAGDLPQVTSQMPTDLNKVWALGLAEISQGGGLSGIGVSTALMGLKLGVVSGSFVTGTLYGPNSSGTLVTYGGGKFPPVAIGLASNYAMIDLGGRGGLDDSTIEYLSSGYAQVRLGGTLSLGTSGIVIQQTASAISLLTSAATLGDVILKVNEAISRMSNYHMA